jgi:alpha-ketoglutarate-dependent taurine dioxygenase
MSGLKIRDLNPMFGAEVIGLDPRVPLDDETGQTLRKLFDERSLLLFRDCDASLTFQTYLSGLLIGQDMVQIDAATGEPAAPMLSFYVSNKEPNSAAPYGRLMFHSDGQWTDDPTQLISLYGSEVEQPATPTLFISSVYGWDTLPEDLRARVKDRFAIQRHDDDTYLKRAKNDSDVLVNSFKNEAFSKLPIAYRHPRTGRIVLYVSQQMTYQIADMSPQESEALLEALFEHLYKPQNIFEHHWRKGDLVLWDNIALQHARPNLKTEGPARTLRKVFAPAQLLAKDKAPAYTRAGAHANART